MKVCLWFSSLRLTTLVLFPEISALRKCSLTVIGTPGQKLKSLYYFEHQCISRLQSTACCLLFCFSFWWCGESLRAERHVGTWYVLHKGGGCESRCSIQCMFCSLCKLLWHHTITCLHKVSITVKGQVNQVTHACLQPNAQYLYHFSWSLLLHNISWYL